MLLSELLHAHIVDADGVDLGSIDDVLVVQDGPMQGAFGAGLRVEGVVAGHRSLGTRLGYHRGGTQGPWLLRVVFAALERRAHYVPWEWVKSVSSEVVRIDARRDDLGPPPP